MSYLLVTDLEDGSARLFSLDNGGDTNLQKHFQLPGDCGTDEKWFHVNTFDGEVNPLTEAQARQIVERLTARAWET